MHVSSREVRTVRADGPGDGYGVRRAHAELDRQGTASTGSYAGQGRTGSSGARARAHHRTRPGQPLGSGGALLLRLWRTRRETMWAADGGPRRSYADAVVVCRR